MESYPELELFSIKSIILETFDIDDSESLKFII